MPTKEALQPRLPRAGPTGDHTAAMPTRRCCSHTMSSAPSLPALLALVLLSACWCEAQAPREARFRLAAPTAPPPNAAPFPAGIPPELQLLVETFSPR